MKFLKPEAENILKEIRLLVLDVDGVLTDGYIIYHDDGRETKTFDVKDGFGLRLLQISGIKVCIATGRMSGALHHRCKNLGIELIFDGLRHKAAILDELIEKTGIPPEHMAFVGDDLLDLSIMNRVALAVAVADGQKEILQSAHAVTRSKGGRGAVREVCEAILKSQGKWGALIERIKTGDI
ncbi:MAG: HAD-IIIA family hydrolase [Thermodesulfobacteriota bacterium]|nr:HAD-IIIA family hydrolase [Thermodesulfobacteriota bacterium]